MDELRVKDLYGNPTVLTFDGAIFEAFAEHAEIRRFHVAVSMPKITVDKKGVVSIVSRTSRFGTASAITFSGVDALNVLTFMEQVDEASRLARRAGA